MEGGGTRTALQNPVLEAAHQAHRGLGGCSWQATHTCKGGEEEPAREQCGWTEDCRWAEWGRVSRCLSEVLIMINGYN